MSASANKNVARLVISIVSAVILSGLAGAGVAVAQVADPHTSLRHGGETELHNVPTPTPSPTQKNGDPTPWG
ncbi:hypothetical protein ACFFMN_24850 [Planobispora siamensis]|uniref:Secreted protein n=1 Tax=Planobispora siamensis TaxID=936338 RepID=A0A8J3WL64_9ACTN|nr:hypothetical protein [Planobispora siamensis]GIH94924.1 hypothetical protein Psi01_55540 [Planobispora siamensis]